jgi:hypothetical protein
MSSVGFEPTTPVFEQENTVHALDRAAAVIGLLSVTNTVMNSKSECMKTVVTSVSCAVTTRSNLDMRFS